MSKNKIDPTVKETRWVLHMTQPKGGYRGMCNDGYYKGSGWYGSGYELMPEDKKSRAKQWKTEKGIKSGLKRMISNLEKEIAKLENMDANNRWQANYLPRMKEQMKSLEGATIVSYEYNPANIIHFGKTNHSTWVEHGTIVSYCSLCGLNLKIVPHLNVSVHRGANVRICPICLTAKVSGAEAYVASMDKDVLKEIKAQSFLKNL